MTKKCDCGKDAVGVITIGIGHHYVCVEHAKQAKKDGWHVDYKNWRLQ